MRAQVVVLRDGEILLARHEAADRTYWVLPGGRIEPGETPEEAAIRELDEEAGLRVRILRQLFVDGPRVTGEVTIRSPRFTFLAEVVDGTLASRPVDEPPHPEKGCLACVEWMPLDSNHYDAATCDTLSLVRSALRDR